MEPFHFRRMSNQYVMEYRWNLGILYVVGSLPYADPGFFRDVSFQYPGSEEYALRNTSFKVGPGQLCVCLLLGVYIFRNKQTLLTFVISIGHYRSERIRKEHDSK